LVREKRGVEGSGKEHLARRPTRMARRRRASQRARSAAVAPAVLAELIRRVRGAVEPLRIILFGSAARGELRAGSDLDILVVAADGTPCRQAVHAIYRRLIGFAWPVDVVVATERDLREHGTNFSLVYYPALREGTVIYAA
ncbi:MAG: nucleotidyltransferase domain-containing protein, partial [Planctomycetota bacterium]|nr:nucleotidyltransferase domain-containing protein [Planctomycetota bacterium]